MKTFMFPGQGSQSKGMGGTLFDEFKELTEKADKILGYSIKELCLEDPRKELAKTQFTQPALYVVNALSYFKRIGESDQKPDFVAGHSLGEFNALLAAECFDFEAGLKLVKRRGELMSLATGGGMAAIINATKEEIESILEKNGLTNIDLANYNTPSQIVISGLKDEIGRAQTFFQTGKILYYPLNTSGAFHSRYMQPAKEKFEIYLKKFKFSDLKIPVIANVTARPYENDAILANLSSQIAGAVRWSESIQYLTRLGDMEFEEIGHGNVLTKFAQKIQETVTKAIESGAKDQKKVEIENKDEATSQSEKIRDNHDTATELAQREVNEDAEENLQLSEKTADFTQTVERGQTMMPDEIQIPRDLYQVKEKVNNWNKNHPIGTKVKSTIMDYEDLETRTEAVVLFGHRAAVYMKGYNGYFDLNEVKPM